MRLRPVLLLLFAAACAKPPPTELITMPSGIDYKVETHERVTLSSGDAFSVAYLTDTVDRDTLAAEAQELFQWAQPDAQSAGLDRVIVTSKRLTDELYGMAKHVNALDVVYQKGPNGEWGHSKPVTSGRK